MEVTAEYLWSVVGKKQVALELKDAEIAKLKAELEAAKAKDAKADESTKPEAG